ncbi:alpha-glucan phosphorylase [Nanobdella aerobiophila]|uniref:Alpha-glucan phosphorylase n=1 Tax=Nanobdella aerobiophila TaxID=2586965 RepID=A0A915WSD5_9ARCH|nr:alpha-glucan family phosphorylase [Nanobdella aerobiophila]BBL45836.1 alpha-glucan phosphorylase [Nanobdella aerobiophila]
MKKIAFISQEFSIGKLPTYAGGLGILAGDLFYSSNDLKYPIYGVGFVNKNGYAEYSIKDKDIIYKDEDYDPLEYFLNIEDKFHVDLKGLRIYFQVWKYSLSHSKLFLFDTDIQENNPNIRKLTGRLYYEENAEEKLLKDLLLGLGTLEFFDKYGINIDKFHLNESHGGFLAIELFKRLKNMEEVREKLVFTTHSIIAGHDGFDYNLVEKYYDIPIEIKNISGNNLSLTKVLLNISGFSNAVSYKHKVVTESVFNKNLEYITNGVHHLRWINNKLELLYDSYIPGWRLEPSKLSYAGSIDRNQFIKVKNILKDDSINYINVNSHQNKSFKNNRILITVKRRLTEYKRFHMLLWRLDKLEELNKKYNIQFLLSGTFHPKDDFTKNTIKWIIDTISTIDVPVGLILRRGLEQERILLAGTDLFLHIPRPPFEASGTSWMRAGLNGTPTLFSRDGSPLEIIIDDLNGWFFGENNYDVNRNTDEKDIENFYDKLDYILNIYRNDYNKFIDVSLNSIKYIGPLFNSYRCFKEYIHKAYE